jgi:hypothetical protein
MLFNIVDMNVIQFRRMQELGIEHGKEVKYPIANDLKFLKERKPILPFMLGFVVSMVASLRQLSFAIKLDSTMSAALHSEFPLQDWPLPKQS